MKVFSQVSTIPGGPAKQKSEISAVLLVQANRSTILSYFATSLKDVAVGYETAGGGSGFSPPMGLRVVWSYTQGQVRAIRVRLNRRRPH